jgi:hypothetical protein
MIKNKNQIKKDLVKRRKATNEAKRLERLSIENLPEIEKIRLEIDNLEYYVNIRYKNDKMNVSKLLFYTKQLNALRTKLKELIESGVRKEIQTNEM